MSEPQDQPTLTDDDIETRTLGRATAYTGDDTGDDTGDTGDDSGDTSDTSDTGDDSGDTTDTGDDS